ncbi:MAG: diadenosine tetraphosphate (Ap4A) HIT family hydrolase [Alphaproteobacteria bacterium]|jgi:diadenosine tetraphosphate (Ap4A) HIT family hydrolase
MFTLDARLKADTIPVGALELCRVLLMNDARFAWVILVPARDGLREIHDLDASGRSLLIEEVAVVSQALEGLYQPDKINVGALGNIVPQLHVHIVARHEGDAAWPGPVWGAGKAVPYDAAALKAVIGGFGAAIKGLGQEK